MSRTLWKDESKIGTLELKLNDKEELEAKMDLVIPTLAGSISLQGVLNAEEISANVKHSLINLAMKGAYEMSITKEEKEDIN